MVFFAPVVIGVVFLPPALEIVANVRPGRSYSPLRTAFLVIEAAWVATALLLGRRGLFLVKVAWSLRKEATDRWGSEQEWFREQAQRAAERRKREGTIAGDQGPDGSDSP